MKPEPHILWLRQHAGTWLGMHTCMEDLLRIISSFPQISDEDLQALLAGGAGQTMLSLTLDGCLDLSGSTMAVIGTTCPKLQVRQGLQTDAQALKNSAQTHQSKRLRGSLCSV